MRGLALVYRSPPGAAQPASYSRAWCAAEEDTEVMSPYQTLVQQRVTCTGLTGYTRNRTGSQATLAADGPQANLERPL